MTAATPAWLERNLSALWLRVLDVRTDRSERDEGSGPRLRPATTVELRQLGHLGGPPDWALSRERHRNRPGPPLSYLRGHVPGSIPFDVREALFDEHGELVSAPELAMVMSSLGVGDEHTIVFVDDGRSGAGAAAVWALGRYGHVDVHVLEGGYSRWLAEGRPTSREIVRLPSASFTARVLP
ncbi:Thiosulfate sulfurtransferase, rhodanese [Labilithrix luteola]|uniref:Thiosulfate sulfurtransferase, rhodanese n=1 Tax=Labilithrix luteola TaxID=1391654 RepID=A0A0K1QBU7_9BACT|nr:Thiosulfate sulfurtransferase, rhodanese [Labilithrix luteola]